MEVQLENKIKTIKIKITLLVESASSEVSFVRINNILKGLKTHI